MPKAKPGSPVPRHSSRAARPWAAELLEPRRMLAAVPVADLELAPASSIPDWITDADGTVFFAGLSPGGEGRELWKTDGTAAGTTLVKDLLPGPGWSEPSTAYLNGKVFVLTDAPGRREVWVTDGTEAGTVLLTKANLDQGTQETSDSRLTPLGGFVYFWASDEEHGWEPLKSDGTPEGTMLVKDINPGPDRSGAYDGKFATFNGRIYFAARDAEDGAGSGLELWSTDGTEAGTARVKDINPGAASSYPQHFLVAGDNLFFDATDAAHGNELWKTDGTEAGTRLVKDIRPGPASSPLGTMTRSGRRLFFTSLTAQSVSQLWVSDGTDAGTAVLAEAATGARFDLLKDVNGTLFLVQRAPYGSNAFGLWKTDGTLTGTAYLAHVDAADLIDFHGTLVFRTNRELWARTGEAMVRLRAFDPSPDEYPALDRLTVAGDTLFFAAYSVAAGRELWKTDGTPQGTVLVRDINPGAAGSEPGENTSGGTRYDLRLTPSGGAVFFGAVSADVGQELWKSDGTEAGTVLVADAFPGTDHSNPFALDDDNGTLFFATSRGVSSGSKVYRTGPSVDGVVRLDGVPSADPEDVVEEMIASNGRLFIAATTWPNPWGRNLWVSDGTAAGSRLISKTFGMLYELTEANGAAYFGADGWNVQSLWKSDGTADGTVPVKDSGPGRGPRNLVNLNGRLFFTAEDSEHGRELWKSDGTPEDTVLVRDVVPGPAGSEPDGLVNVDGTLFFRVVTPAGTELWKSDGMNSGTVRVAALSPRPADYYIPPKPGFGWYRPRISWGAGLNGVLLFANGGSDGVELWRSDGTEAGTVLVKDIEAGAGGANPSGFVEFDGRVYFSAYDRTSGRELWSTDGTRAGTARVQDIYPGPIGSSPTWLTPSGGALWFGAAGREIGRELWKYTSPPPAAVVAREVFYNHSGFDWNDAAATAADDNAIAADKNALLAGDNRIPGFDNITGYDKGINGVMIDIAGLSVVEALLDVNDFEFSPAGNGPISVTVRPGAGVGGSDRVTLIWRDYNPQDASPLPQAVANGWLTVTVKANAHTGLDRPDVFSFGNLIGETGDGGGAAGWRASALDLTTAKRSLNTAAPITSSTDFNRDGRTNALDLAIVKRNLNRGLPLFPGPAAPAPAFVALPASEAWKGTVTTNANDPEPSKAQWVSGLLE